MECNQGCGGIKDADRVQKGDRTSYKSISYAWYFSQHLIKAGKLQQLQKYLKFKKTNANMLITFKPGILLYHQRKHTQGVSPSDGSHHLCSSGEAPQSGNGLSSLQYTMLSGHPVQVKENRSDEILYLYTTVTASGLKCDLTFLTSVQVIVRLKKVQFRPKCSMKVWSMQQRSTAPESTKATFPRFVHITYQSFA